MLIAAPLATTADPMRLALPDDGIWLLLLGAVWIALNVATVATFAVDKRAASRRGARRIPERTLHLLELFGGWPGSLLAQQWLRHKTLKASYRRVFWSIVGLHLTVALSLSWMANG